MDPGVLDDIDAMVKDEERVVTAKFLSRTLSLPLRQAKSVLQGYWEQHKEEVTAVWVVSGWIGNGDGGKAASEATPAAAAAAAAGGAAGGAAVTAAGAGTESAGEQQAVKEFLMRLVPSAHLAEAQEAMGGASAHIYSVQRLLPRDLAVLCAADGAMGNGARESSLSVVQPPPICLETLSKRPHPSAHITAASPMHSHSPAANPAAAGAPGADRKGQHGQQGEHSRGEAESKQETEGSKQPVQQSRQTKPAEPVGAVKQGQRGQQGGVGRGESENADVKRSKDSGDGPLVPAAATVSGAAAGAAGAVGGAGAGGAGKREDKGAKKGNAEKVETDVRGHGTNEGDAGVDGSCFRGDGSAGGADAAREGKEGVGEVAAEGGDGDERKEREARVKEEARTSQEDGEQRGKRGAAEQADEQNKGHSDKELKGRGQKRVKGEDASIETRGDGLDSGYKEEGKGESGKKVKVEQGSREDAAFGAEDIKLMTKGRRGDEERGGGELEGRDEEAEGGGGRVEEKESVLAEVGGGKEDELKGGMTTEEGKEEKGVNVKREHEAAEGGAFGSESIRLMKKGRKGHAKANEEKEEKKEDKEKEGKMVEEVKEEEEIAEVEFAVRLTPKAAGAIKGRGGRERRTVWKTDIDDRGREVTRQVEVDEFGNEVVAAAVGNAGEGEGKREEDIDRDGAMGEGEPCSTPEERDAPKQSTRHSAKASAASTKGGKGQGKGAEKGGGQGKGAAAAAGAGKGTAKGGGKAAGKGGPKKGQGSIILAGGMPGSDVRGWILSPMHMAAAHGLGGAKSCVDVHVGTIGPGKVRGNHRHHTKSESFLIWGANARIRIENPSMPAGYAEVMLDAADVAVFTGPAGRAHALENVDKQGRTLILSACADTEWDPAHPDTDYHIWKDM
ncbi:unnamed protein product [Closterium sp. Yama58-4]|nr:unnamed protein product [Closterium sp. Yama58-4]